jgi:hypothetical protein
MAMERQTQPTENWETLYGAPNRGLGIHEAKSRQIAYDWRGWESLLFLCARNQKYLFQVERPAAAQSFAFAGYGDAPAFGQGGNLTCLRMRMRGVEPPRDFTPTRT